MEKSKRNSVEIPGTVSNSQNGQLLVSSGIQSLDSILGGGLPVGTVTIIEEDMHGNYAKVILDYFLAEGIVSTHSNLVASLDLHPHSIIKSLPAVVQADEDFTQHPVQNDQMKIAFRYQNLPTAHHAETESISHNFNLSKTMSMSDIENSDICYWNGQRFENGTSLFANPFYNELLKAIKAKIKDGKFFLKDSPSNRNILRIGILSLGSPMWLPQTDSFHLLEDSRDLDTFIFCLRALVRSAYAVAVITIPTHLYHENSLDRCIHSSDIAMRLQAFSGTELENNVSLSEFHGFFHLTKLAAINSFTSKHPGAVEYVFKLRRRKFQIEKLHLPPDLQESGEKGGGGACGSSDKKLLEF